MSVLSPNVSTYNFEAYVHGCLWYMAHEYACDVVLLILFFGILSILRVLFGYIYPYHMSMITVFQASNPEGLG